jgi:hypothetical protein
MRGRTNGNEQIRRGRGRSSLNEQQGRGTRKALEVLPEKCP